MSLFRKHAAFRDLLWRVDEARAGTDFSGDGQEMSFVHVSVQGLTNGCGEPVAQDTEPSLWVDYWG